MRINIKPEMTDYFAINSPRVAKVMRNWPTQKREGRAEKRKADRAEFRGGVARLGSLPRLLWFMLRSMVWRMPLKKTTGDTLELVEPGKVMLQAEGEGEILENVEKIEIKLAERKLKVVRQN